MKLWCLGIHYYSVKGFSGGSVVKNPPANARDADSIPGKRKIPWRRKWQPTPVFLPGKTHGHSSLAGPWGCKRVRHDLATKQQHYAVKLQRKARNYYFENSWWWLPFDGREGAQGDYGDSGSVPVLDGGGGYVTVGFVIIHWSYIFCGLFYRCMIFHSLRKKKV